jgi:hypothetical protein
MKDLPIGISSLKTIIESGMVYVDKTMFAEELVKKSLGAISCPAPAALARASFSTP